MPWLTNFLTGLLSSIIRPIIQEELGKLKLHIADSIERKRIYEKYDREAQELISAMAEASTSEERYAILSRIRNARAVLD